MHEAETVLKYLYESRRNVCVHGEWRRILTCTENGKLKDGYGKDWGEKSPLKVIINILLRLCAFIIGRNDCYILTA